jgi:hypothetical protein
MTDDRWSPEISVSWHIAPVREDGWRRVISYRILIMTLVYEPPVMRAWNDMLYIEVE